MFGSSILEMAIGLVLVYSLLSLVCSALRESLEGWMKIRATNLEQGLRVLLLDMDGTRLVQHIYTHPLIYGLFPGHYDPAKTRVMMTTNLPTYIPAESFAVALMDYVVRGPLQGGPEKKEGEPDIEMTFDNLRSAVTKSTVLNASVQRMLQLAIDSAHGDLANVQANIEMWFNRGMEQVTWQYKRRNRGILLCIGLLITVLLNVDSLRLAQDLYHNDAMRAVTVAKAGAAAKSDTLPEAIRELTTLSQLNLQIGWQTDYTTSWYTRLWNTAHVSIAGWLITAFAISYGAPFWFNLLNRLIAVRSTFKPDEESRGKSRNTKRD